MKINSTPFKFLWLFTLLTLPLSPKAQVIFRDDFTRDLLGQDWLTTGYARWSIVNGLAYNLIDGAGGTLTTSNKYSAASYVLETKVYPLKNGYWREYGIVFGKPSPDADYGYILKYHPYYNLRLILGRSDGNEFYPIVLDQKHITLDPDKQYSIKIVKSAEGKIDVYLNSGSGYSKDPVLEATDKTYPALGHMGLRVDTQTAAEPYYVDWIEARSLPSLITDPKTESGDAYEVANMGVNVPLYVDRDYNLVSLPDFLQGVTFIQTGNETKRDKRPSFLKFNLDREAIVYVAYDPRAKVLPEWLNGWQKLTDKVYTTDPGTSYLNVYTKVFPAGTVTLGGNLAAPAAGALTNYLVAAIPSGSVAARESIFPEIAGRLQPAATEAFSDEITATGFYPNPARDKAAIRYTLQQAATVNLTLFDKQGRSIATFVNERKQAGKHAEVIDVQHLAEGIYLYQLRTGDQIQSGKMLIKH
ncbi:T9SS type A sorting domain-containing protein [Dyadobacter flavalbus]|uniref:T9SS type A sorting domain-containing protein n=1 Tax=Dyadobacter flavalbus TaxID=2579942 RepID=A0A5M8QXQ3_9BACT|nr:T9SS type A sorting domain-containing protein [Dyadobacter flavalbus]KAA6439820.1 T9SS type A sorting domain-containing protein [Dyadobacter flavalbus]